MSLAPTAAAEVFAAIPCSPSATPKRAEPGGFQRGAFSGWRAALPCAARSLRTAPLGGGPKGPRGPLGRGPGGRRPPASGVQQRQAQRRSPPARDAHPGGPPPAPGTQKAPRPTRRPPSRTPSAAANRPPAPRQAPQPTGAGATPSAAAKPNRHKGRAKPDRRKGRATPQQRRSARRPDRRPQAGRAAAERARRGSWPRRSVPATRAGGRPAAQRRGAPSRRRPPRGDPTQAHAPLPPPRVFLRAARDLACIDPALVRRCNGRRCAAPRTLAEPPASTEAYTRHHLARTTSQPMIWSWHMSCTPPFEP